MFNGSFGYADRKFTARLSANFSDPYVDEIGVNAFEDRHYDTQFFCEFQRFLRHTDQLRIYADLNGKIIEDKTIRNIKRPNKVDVEYGFRLNDSTTTDILDFTERVRKHVRIFSVPDMQPLDDDGIPVFEDEDDPQYQLPIGGRSLQIT